MIRDAMTMRKWGFAGFAWLMLPTAAFAQTTSVEYLHTDALGSPVATTDASGAVIERQVYESYGVPISHGPTDGPGFTGHVEDIATGLTYMQQRYYDAEIGAFLSVDPISTLGADGQFNRYRYANGNPYRFVDPDGRVSKDDAKDRREHRESLKSHATNNGVRTIQVAAGPAASGSSTSNGVMSGNVSLGDGKQVNLIDLAFGVADVGIGASEIVSGLPTIVLQAAVDEYVDPLSAARVGLGAATLMDGVNGIQTAFDGKAREPTLQTLGGDLMGPVGAMAGLGLSTITTAQGWRNVLRGGPKSAKEIVEVMQANRQYQDALNGK